MQGRVAWILFCKFFAKDEAPEYPQRKVLFSREYWSGRPASVARQKNR